MPLTERSNHTHSTKSRSVLLVRRFQIMESKTSNSPLVQFFFNFNYVYFIIAKNIKLCDKA